MSFTYSYQIISVDEAARCMEIVYTSEGRQTWHVSARLPYEDEPLAEVIEAFAPVPQWLEAERAVVAPTVGVTGVVTVAPAVPPADFVSAVQSASGTTTGAQTL